MTKHALLLEISVTARQLSLLITHAPTSKSIAQVMSVLKDEIFEYEHMEVSNAG